jgi:hypothetical protein
MTKVLDRPKASLLTMMISWSGSSGLEGVSTGRRPRRRERSAMRADRLAERVEAKVATPRKSVPTAVPISAIVVTSVMG